VGTRENVERVYAERRVFLGLLERTMADSYIR